LILDKKPGYQKDIFQVKGWLITGFKEVEAVLMISVSREGIKLFLDD
jgi:hypothetical protein